MLEFLLIASPIAIILSAIIRGIVIARCSDDGPADTGTARYTVCAESGYADSDNRYEFTLRRHGSGYRCYIDRTPSYRGRSTDAGVIHRLSDNRGYYICYTANLPYLEQAKTLCRNWSNMTQRYIETGKTFEE